MGLVWKNQQGTFRSKPTKVIPETNAVKQYFHRLNVDTAMFFERPESRFVTSLYKTILESVIYGTSGLAAQSGGYKSPLKFHNQTILSFYIGYTKDCEIATLFIDYHYTAHELFSMYGFSAGPAVHEAIAQHDYARRFTVTEAIRPRTVVNAKSGKLAMPYSSEMFMPNENVWLGEGGYESLPIKVLFYDKLEYESYGRSPGMEALPTVMQLNTCSEILAIGGELTAQPSLGMYDNGSLAGLTLDVSAGALNVFNVAGTVPAENPIFPLYTVGDLRVMYEWMGMLKQETKEYFLLDKLYDLNQQQRMTLGEAMIREGIRSDSLTPIFTQILSFLDTAIQRAGDILFGLGLWGVPNPEDTSDPLVQSLLNNGFDPFGIPDEVLTIQQSGLDWYDIEFICPATRIMNTEELQSTLKFIEVMGQAGAYDQDFLDVINPDATAEKIKDLTATDSVIVRTMEERLQRRQARQEVMAQRAQIEAEVAMASARQMNAQAAASQSNALRTLGGGV